jgi:hypothetical protein
MGIRDSEEGLLKMAALLGGLREMLRRPCLPAPNLGKTTQKQ